ncbi:hypothetical protein [Nocardia sp. NPDC058497]|uniref:hypothetical protein n=1 Tax=Nocardia sp. NPDC058497 TaxID=3346529 RepID=UPI003664F8C1
MKYIGMKFINFRDYDFEPGGRHCFQWVDVRTFMIPDSAANDDAVIDEVLRTVEYRDDYVGGGIDVDGIRHGPYWISSLSPSSFDLIDHKDAVDVLDRWLQNCGLVPAALRAELGSSVNDALAGADSIYLLKDLGDSAKNDYGNLHMEFHELMAIDRSAKVVSLIVLTDD